MGEMRTNRSLEPSTGTDNTNDKFNYQNILIG